MNATVAFISAAFVLLEALVAVLEGVMTKGQMHARGIITRMEDKALPFWAHGGMWGDLFLMSPMLGIVSSYHQQWTAEEWVRSLSIGILVSAGMHWQYRKGDPCSTNYHGRLTLGGYLHAVYFAIALAALIQFFFHTADISALHAIAISAMLAVFIPLGFLQPSIYVHGNVNGQAWFQFIACLAGIFAACLSRFHFWKGAW